MESIDARFKKGRYMCTLKELEKEILKNVIGGPIFNKMFLIIMENAVIEMSGDSMCKSKILHFIDNADQIKNMNWCG